ncbi:hypothetical protein H0H81_007723 [Sphagnurus paluster]|uniref:Flavin-containing monooxygenase n=1 Tax=Sphagnurus paluster TaxID=117069 RepID=A0A9P7K671_9AGAR|nr:hypothetical protein H0H81_007723 [Sphagnurus paluster]
MYFWLLVLAEIATIIAASQTPLLAPHQAEGLDHYAFKWPIKKVAIIGAGPSGLINYREFTHAGFDVRVFERDTLPGGNWHYSEEAPNNTPIPNAHISVGDYIPSLPPKGVELPCEEVYEGPDITEFPWPKGTSWELPHAKIARYIRAFASYHGVNSNDENPRISYNTRVERVEKHFSPLGEEAGWTLTLKTLTRTGPHSVKATWRTENFDAVVIASGRYNAPNIPNIKGLKEWANVFPKRIIHSRQYRRPQSFANQTVLIVGAATSGGEIARDLNPHVKKIYQSIRPDNVTKPHFRLDFFLRRIPANISIVPEIKQFHAPGKSIHSSGIELANGTVHNTSITSEDDGEEDQNEPRPIVTDGTHLRSLYLDIFYIEEPTLVNVGMQSFTYAEYIGVALSKVWAGTAHLPTTREMWRRQRERVAELGGYGPHFQFLGSERTDR